MNQTVIGGFKEEQNQEIPILISLKPSNMTPSQKRKAVFGIVMRITIVEFLLLIILTFFYPKESLSVVITVYSIYITVTLGTLWFIYTIIIGDWIPKKR